MPLEVCATPIGNLGDVTLRVLDALRAADLVLCEDTRRTRILLDRHGIAAAALQSLNEHNEGRRIASVLPRLQAGDRVALCSDAGTPGIADPGARLVRAALDAGVPVHVLPGASAVTTALVASGLSGGAGYRFVGWVPRRAAERASLWEELRGSACPAVAFESPNRLTATLASLAAALPDRPVAVCRELTKAFEEVVRGSAAEVAARIAEPPRGEIVLVVGARDPGADAGEHVRRAAAAAVAELVRAGTPRKVAAEVVAGLTGVGRNELYEIDL